MTSVTAVVLGVGSAAGALLRYAISVWLMRRQEGTAFPISTWVANVIGAGVFGLCLHALTKPQPEPLWIELGMSFCGGFTTFSAWSVETVTLFQRNRLQAVSYSISSLAVAMGMLILTWHFG